MANTRYRIEQSIVNGQWRVIDTHVAPSSNGTGWAGAQAVVVDNLRTQKQARDVKAALVEAYFAGANAVKTGEVII